MKVCLIQPPPNTETDKHWARFPVLGLAYIASAIRSAGHELLLLDGKLGELTKGEIIARAVTFDPDVIGITAMTVEFPASVEIASGIKARSSAPIIIGGAHVNAVKDQVLRECESIDFGCSGEGEHLIVELLSAIETQGSLAEIPGLIYRDENTIKTNSVRPYPKNYDELVFPAWDLFQRGDHLPILTHRGCPYQCTFCGHNSGFKARFRSVENVLKELRGAVRAYSPEVVRFEDETFGLDMKRTKAILEGIIASGLHKSVKFSAQTRVDRADAEFVRLLREANFETLELGVETGNAEVLKSIRKGITLPQVVHAVQLARENGLKVWCKFIIGHPNETVANARDTVRFIAKLNPDQLSVSVMTPFPGTPIHEMAIRGEAGYRMIADDWQDFDKYSTGALELTHFPLWKMKFYQILCYVALYVWNLRFLELIKLVSAHRALARELVVGAFSSFIYRSTPQKPSFDQAAPVTRVRTWRDRTGLAEESGSPPSMPARREELSKSVLVLD